MADLKKGETSESPPLRPKRSPGQWMRKKFTQSRRLSTRRTSGLGDLLDGRQSKDHLVKEGIYKPEPVFGNFLENLPLDEESGLPVFVKILVDAIEEKIDTVGLYRVNGDNAAMQKLRYNVLSKRTSI